MTLTLNTIKPKKGSTKARKRIGRGNASGTGTYSGKGQKGQKSRSGVSGLKRLGMKHILQQTPKSRGFKSQRPKNQVIKVDDINKNFKDNDTIDPGILLKLGLIAKIKLPIKVLGKEELKLKKITLSKIKVSESVKTQVEKNGGKIE